jgi:hypothetical protein
MAQDYLNCFEEMHGGREEEFVENCSGYFGGTNLDACEDG